MARQPGVYVFGSNNKNNISMNNSFTFSSPCPAATPFPTAWSTAAQTSVPPSRPDNNSNSPTTSVACQQHFASDVTGAPSAADGRATTTAQTSVFQRPTTSVHSSPPPLRERVKAAAHLHPRAQGPDVDKPPGQLYTPTEPTHAFSAELSDLVVLSPASKFENFQSYSAISTSTSTSSNTVVNNHLHLHLAEGPLTLPLNNIIDAVLPMSPPSEWFSESLRALQNKNAEHLYNYVNQLSRDTVEADTAPLSDPTLRRTHHLRAPDPPCERLRSSFGSSSVDEDVLVRNAANIDRTRPVLGSDAVVTISASSERNVSPQPLPSAATSPRDPDPSYPSPAPETLDTPFFPSDGGYNTTGSALRKSSLEMVPIEDEKTRIVRLAKWISDAKDTVKKPFNKWTKRRYRSDSEGDHTML